MAQPPPVLSGKTSTCWMARIIIIFHVQNTEAGLNETYDEEEDEDGLDDEEDDDDEDPVCTQATPPVVC